MWAFKVAVVHYFRPTYVVFCLEDNWLEALSLTGALALAISAEILAYMLKLGSHWNKSIQTIGKSSVD
jgi:hypothetical protein